MTTKKRVGKKRLSMDLPIGIHREVEKIAKDRNITITRLLMQWIWMKIEEQKNYE